MKRAATMLQEAGVVTPALKNIMSVCDDVGVLASKPTGAGGGGAILALLDHEHAATQLKALRTRLRPLSIFEVTIPC
jgi:mevalonate kinase